MSHSLKCLLWKALWGLGAVSLVLAWLSIYQQALVFGLDPAAWYWNALGLVVLSIPIKLDCSNCGACMPKM